MKVAVIQSNYLPWKGYFDIIQNADLFIFYDEVQYTKNDWRNRNRIYTQNGLQWLSIPIAANAVHKKISEVGFLKNDWQELHRRSLSFGYKKAKYYDQIAPLLKEVYEDRNWERLSELNQYLIRKISNMIGIRTHFEDSASYQLAGDRVGRLLSLLKQVGATEYISGPSAKSYLQASEDLFVRQGIRIRYKEYPPYPKYQQLADPFRHDVSIIDLLAHLPCPEIKNYIWDISNHD